MKKVFIVLFQLAFTTIIFAQNGATVSDRIFDGETNNHLPFASVTINLEN